MFIILTSIEDRYFVLLSKYGDTYQLPSEKLGREFIMNKTSYSLNKTKFNLDSQMAETDYPFNEFDYMWNSDTTYILCTSSEKIVISNDTNWFFVEDARSLLDQYQRRILQGAIRLFIRSA